MDEGFQFQSLPFAHEEHARKLDLCKAFFPDACPSNHRSWTSQQIAWHVYVTLFSTAYVPKHARTKADQNISRRVFILTSHLQRFAAYLDADFIHEICSTIGMCCDWLRALAPVLAANAAFVEWRYGIATCEQGRKHHEWLWLIADNVTKTHDGAQQAQRLRDDAKQLAQISLLDASFADSIRECSVPAQYLYKYMFPEAVVEAIDAAENAKAWKASMHAIQRLRSGLKTYAAADPDKVCDLVELNTTNTFMEMDLCLFNTLTLVPLTVTLPEEPQSDNSEYTIVNQTSSNIQHITQPKNGSTVVAIYLDGVSYAIDMTKTSKQHLDNGIVVQVQGNVISIQRNQPQAKVNFSYTTHHDYNYCAAEDKSRYKSIPGHNASRPWLNRGKKIR